MILGIGVDSVEIQRFAHWHTYSHKKLLRIFSQQEIEYCLQQPNKSAERFAVRFAAREAFFKAICAAFPNISFPFLTLCKYVSVEKQKGRPILVFDWKSIGIECNACSLHIALTHTDSTATAFVIIEKVIY